MAWMFEHQFYFELDEDLDEDRFLLNRNFKPKIAANTAKNLEVNSDENVHKGGSRVLEMFSREYPWHNLVTV